jgi:hypothetical protein
MSIVALGNAVGAFTKGYKEGERHFSEMEDAKQVRKLRGIQIDEAERKNKATQNTASIIKEYLPFITGEGFEGGAPAQPTAAPMPPVMENPAAGETPVMGLAGPNGVTQAPVQAPPARGIAVPGADVAPEAASPAQPAPQGPRRPANRMEAMQEMFSRLNLNALESGQYDPKQAMELALGMGKKFTDAKTDQALGAMNQWLMTGDQGSAESALAQAGIQLPPGSKWEKARTEIVPGSGIFVDDVKVSAPDGSRSISMTQLMASRMDPKEFMTLQTEIGFKVADLSLKKEAEQNLNAYREGMLDMRGQELAAQIENWRSQNQTNLQQRIVMAEQLNDLRGAQAFKARMQANDGALNSIFQSIGISREITADKLDMMSDSERQKYQNNMSLGFAAHTIWQMNLSPDNKEGISTSEALRFARDAGKITEDKIKTDDSGNAFVMFGNKKVFVPGFGGASETPPPAPGAQQPEPARPGVTPPRANQQPMGRTVPAGIRTPELPPQSEAAGQQLDAARAAYREALNTVRAYGSRQQKADPQGYQRAQAAVAQAEVRLREAQAAFGSTIPQSMQGPIGQPVR